MRIGSLILSTLDAQSYICYIYFVFKVIAEFMVTECTRGSIQSSHCNCKLDAAIGESVSEFERTLVGQTCFKLAALWLTWSLLLLPC